MHDIMSCVLCIVTAPGIVCRLVLKPDPSPKGKGSLAYIVLLIIMDSANTFEVACWASVICRCCK